MSLSKEAGFEHAQRPVPCDTCEGEEPGTYYCRDCKKTLCEECENFHKKLTKDHKVVLRAHIGEIDTSILTCTDHGHEASLHCEKCNLPVCIECVTGKHQGHNMVNLRNVMDRKKEMIQEDVNTIQKEILPILMRQGEEIKSKRENYNKSIQKITRELESQNDAIHKEVDRIHNERLQKIHTFQQNNLLHFDKREIEIKTKIELCQNRVTGYQDAIRKNNLPAIISIAGKKNPLPEAESGLELPQPPSYVPFSVEEFIQSLARVQIPFLLEASLKRTVPTILSRFLSPLPGRPRICITKDGDIWLGGHETRKLALVNIKGEILMEKEIKKTPYMIAVTECGDFIVSPIDNSTVVERITKKGKEQVLIDLSPTSSLGVTVTSNKCILICTQDGRILRTDSNGTTVTQIYKGNGKGSASHAREDNDGNIYVCDRKNSVVLKISDKGEVLSTINQTTDGQKFIWLVGVASDKIGNILVADREGDCVYIIDQKQKVTELLGREHGIKKPTFLEVDNHNNLWLTQRDGNIFVVKYLEK